MRFNQHSELKDKHSFLSASKYHWVNYTPEKLLESYSRASAAARGSALHAFAHQAVQLGIKLPNTQQTLNLYVNDCIGYRMQTEQPLVYSENAFGTADAINFHRNLITDAMVLRIFDLKNGVTPASFTQLEVYAAYFCLEYKIRPMEIEYDLRIYQNDDIEMHDADPEDIAYIMDRIKEFDKLIKRAQEEGV